MTEMNYSSPPYKSSGKNCSNRIVRFISPVPAEECVVEVQNNYFADHSRNRSSNRSAKMKVLMRADTHKHINVIKEEDEDQKEYKCNASQVPIFTIELTLYYFFIIEKCHRFECRVEIGKKTCKGLVLWEQKKKVRGKG